MPNGKKSSKTMTENYIPQLYSYFQKLSENNNREWFNANRPEYEHLRELWLNDIDRLIASMQQWWPALAGQTAKASAYRIYRDTRFSPDKTPYKTFFSAAISPWGRKDSHAAFYIETGLPNFYDTGLYGGIWCLESSTLKKLRHAIVDNIEEWEEIVNDPRMLKYFPGWCSSTLKTIPKGWERNHPQAEYLRMTNYGKFYHTSPEFYADPLWPEHASEILSTLLPFINFLNYSIDE